MKVLSESGVLASSERFFSTPSTIARKLFFYITRCGHYYCSTEYDFQDTSAIAQEESHRNFFLLYVRSGLMHVIADGVEADVGRGQCAILDCSRPHRYYAVQESETLWIHFDGANSRAFYEQILQYNSGRFVVTSAAESRIEALMAQIIASLREDHIPFAEAEYSLFLYRILGELLFPTLGETHRVDHPIMRAMRFISEHLCEDLSVERIAAAVNLSPSHFSRQFRAYTGFSPHEYIILHRIDKAKELLHNTDLSVKQIAFQVGYRSEVNFITSFKSKTGDSPTAFRKCPMG